MPKELSKEEKKAEKLRLKEEKKTEKALEKSPATPTEVVKEAPRQLDKPSWVDGFVWQNLSEEGKKNICSGSPLEGLK